MFTCPLCNEMEFHRTRFRYFYICKCKFFTVSHFDDGKYSTMYFKAELDGKPYDLTISMLDLDFFFSNNGDEVKYSSVTKAFKDIQDLKILETLDS